MLSSLSLEVNDRLIDEYILLSKVRIKWEKLFEVELAWDLILCLKC